MGIYRTTSVCEKTSVVLSSNIKKYWYKKKIFRIFKNVTYHRYFPSTNAFFKFRRHYKSRRQGRYDTNLARVNDFIESLKTRLYNSAFDATTIQNIRFRFNSEFTSQVAKYDLSSSATTQKVIQWLDEGYNHIINIELKRSSSEENARQEEIIKKEELRKESLKVEVDSFKIKYGGYYVSSIEEYDLKDKKWVKVETSNNRGQVYYKGTTIYFRKSYTSNWIFRQLIYQDYSNAYKAYNYTSPYGETKINDAFTIITFYDSHKMFIYTLGKFDKNIKL